MTEQQQPPDPDSPLSRRSFLKGAGSAAAGAAFVQGARGQEAAEATTEETGVETLRGTLEVTLDINGEARRLNVEPRSSLLSALRTRLEPALTGTKDVCDRGNCGACTVLVDDKPAYSCLLLAATLEGKSIRTVEGFGTPESMSPVQEAFCEKDALMCGFCTPGFVVASEACLAKHPDADDETIRHELSGNICRCGTYPHIFEAVAAARDAMQAGGEGR